MASISRFLTTRLRLKVNESKSGSSSTEERKFLGFSIANDGSERRIAPKALIDSKRESENLPVRTRGVGLPELIGDLAPYLIDGAATLAVARRQECCPIWTRGFAGECVCISAAVEEWTKSLQGTAPTWCSKVQRCGSPTPVRPTGSLAYVRPSCDPTGTAQSLFRLNRSSESGRIFYGLNSIETAVVRDPYAPVV